MSWRRGSCDASSYCDMSTPFHGTARSPQRSAIPNDNVAAD